MAAAARAAERPSSAAARAAAAYRSPRNQHGPRRHDGVFHCGRDTHVHSASPLLRKPSDGGESVVHEAMGATLAGNAHSFVDAIGRRLDEHDDVGRFEVFDMIREQAIFHVAEEEVVNPLQQVNSLLAGEGFYLLESCGLHGLHLLVEYGPRVSDSHHLASWNS